MKNKEGLDEYNYLTRHSTVYIKYGGIDGSSYIRGEQDQLSKITSHISEGTDHLPSIVGDITVTVICSLLYTYMWFDHNCFEKDGSLNSIGKLIVSIAIVAAVKIGFVTTLNVAFSVVVGILTVLVLAVIAEFVFDSVMTVVNYVCEKN